MARPRPASNGMNFAPLYLIVRLTEQLLAFFRHWYWDSFIAANKWVRALLARIDRRIALRITLRNLFQPLYQDYTALGYTLGFIFRSVRIALGAALYAVLITAALALYALWLSLPLFLLYKLI